MVDVMVCCVCGEVDDSHSAYCTKHGRSPHRLLSQEKQKLFKTMLEGFDDAS